MRLPKLASSLLLAISVVCVAQTQFPNTPAGHQFAGWLESFNRGDANLHREFLQKNSPSRISSLDREMSFRQRTGGFDLKKIEESTATKVSALVQERSSDQMGSPEPGSAGRRASSDH